MAASRKHNAKQAECVICLRPFAHVTHADDVPRTTFPASSFVRFFFRAAVVAATAVSRGRTDAYTAHRLRIHRGGS